MAAGEFIGVFGVLFGFLGLVAAVAIPVLLGVIAQRLGGIERRLAEIARGSMSSEAEEEPWGTTAPPSAR